MNRLLFLSLAAFAALMVEFSVSCTRINPLDEPAPAPPGPIAGQITVNVLNGTTPTAAGVAVQVNGPDGFPMTLDTVAVPTGQVIFNVSQQGAYRVGLANQPAAAPSYQTIVLNSAHTFANVVLQESGAYLQAVPVDGKGNSFAGYSETHVLSVSYFNPSALQQDLVMTVDATGLPIGWSSSFSNSFLAAGGSTTLTINTGQMTNVSVVAVPIVGLVAGVKVISQGVVLSKNWSVSVSRCYSESNSNCTGNSHTGTLTCDEQCTESFTVHCTNCPSNIFSQCTLVDVYSGDLSGNNYLVLNGSGSVSGVPVGSGDGHVSGLFSGGSFAPFTHNWTLAANGVFLMSASDTPSYSISGGSGGLSPGTICY